MALILIPQMSGAMLPANVHQRMVRKTGNFINTPSTVSDLGSTRAHLSIDSRKIVIRSGRGAQNAAETQHSND